jgi:hypothetical protein
MQKEPSLAGEIGSFPAPCRALGSLVDFRHERPWWYFVYRSGVGCDSNIRFVTRAP